MKNYKVTIHENLEMKVTVEAGSAQEAANVYAHLDYNSKLSSADAMVNGLKGALSAIN